MFCKQMRHLLHIVLILFLFAATLTVFPGCGEKGLRLSQLEELERMNRADSLMTNDSLAQILSDYFDRHGTPNERMRAHYILGRTFADKGEAPQAISCYQNAAEAADTTAADCDYRTLCRVYAQMGTVLFLQNLYRDELECIDRAVYYANLADDTLSVLLALTQKMNAYQQLMMPDSMLWYCEVVSNKFREAGYSEKAADLMALPVRYLSDRGELSKARRHLEIYESESEYFDSCHNIEKGREVYYYTKGYFYLANCQYDSAEYCFRKELRLGKDFNNQNAGSRGLALLYQKLNRPDSAAKYALYSYAMNDSVYFYEATSEVARLRSMYNYTRYQRQAEIDRDNADKAHHRVAVLLLIVVATLLITAISILKYRSIKNKHQKDEAAYHHLERNYQQTKRELSDLQAHKQQFDEMVKERNDTIVSQREELQRMHHSEQILNDLIKQKEKELSRQNAELALYRSKVEKVSVNPESDESLLNGLEFYQHIIETTNIGQHMTKQDWKAVYTFIEERLPVFYQFINDNHRLLTEYEYQTSILIRLYLKPKNISNALGMDGSYVTRVRRSLLKKLFNMDGSSKELDILIRQIDQITRN